MDLQNISGLTPLMKQYFTLKQEHQDVLLLFQVGDFYEIFFEDAKKVSSFLGITLTKRGELDGQPIPLCGFPIHSIDHYIPKLVKGGFKVALCDQLEPAITGKMVPRGITNILTPGTLTADNLLDAKSNSYLLSFFPTKSGYGLLFSELLSTQLHATVLPNGASRQLETEIFRFLPDEILLLQNRSMSKYATFFKERGFFTTEYQTTFDEIIIQEETNWLLQHFDNQSMHIAQKETALLYATILWKKYVQKNQKIALDQFKSISWYDPESFLLLDPSTQKNLDLIKNSFDGSRTNTVFSLIDKAITPMGSRVIKRWLLSPLVEKEKIEQRQNVIQEFLESPIILQSIKELLAHYADIQRIIGRIALDKAQLAEYIHLSFVLKQLPSIKLILNHCSATIINKIVSSIHDFTELEHLLYSACNNEPTSEWIIKQGFNQELDYIRDLVQNGSKKIVELEQAEQQRTGISSLKIRQNNLYGYYIEVTTKNSISLPNDYIEQQSLVNRKRYSTQSLQTLQFEIMQAQQSFTKKEKELFIQIKEKVRTFIPLLRDTAQAIAQLDALVGFTNVAYEHGYTRPFFGNDRNIIIQKGKHPIIAHLQHQRFIANDTALTDQQYFWIITGPNMGGKSTYLRQVALICLLAQTGCFVPANYAHLPILDRIFTRIGAGDHLAQGKSTFLVEMEETAQICLQATEKSLVILDEVGRGTSTYDGLALAQAIVEYLVTHIKARCLFATHYHELTSLEKDYSVIACYYMESQKTAKGIVFLHTLSRGCADKSFGIEVAKLAQLPNSIITKAQQILNNLQQKKVNHPEINSSQSNFDVYQGQKKIIDYLQKLDLDAITPRQALDELSKLKDFVNF
ncbi:DNA mismatch repair protein MutS [Candidatus Dependentiae bacterium]|nr:DNA mismatch repair protein MutS [Candidatus Dependentiae bacterium]